MKERPILFNGQMVRAILDGRKTQTRRVVNPLLSQSFADPIWSFGDGSQGRGWYVSESDYPEEGSIFIHGPYGQVGDRLWVRETWAPMCMVADPQCWCEDAESIAENHYVEYRASSGHERPGDWPKDDPEAPRWRPSIHMPRGASRISLEIIGVRVERLQEISHEDAGAEGIQPGTYDLRDQRLTVNQIAFSHLWDSINAERGLGWESNPWVWVVEFKNISTKAVRHQGTHEDATAQH